MGYGFYEKRSFMDVRKECIDGFCDNLDWKLAPLLNDPSFKAMTGAKQSVVWKEHSPPHAIISGMTDMFKTETRYFKNFLNKGGKIININGDVDYITNWIGGVRWM